MERRFMVPAYIRRRGELVEFVRLDVAAPNRETALSMVNFFYREKNLDAGINTDAVVELTDFAPMFANR